MNMARIDYSQKISGDNIAKAKANELNMSPKHSIEIATFIRHQRVNDAIAYLNEVVSLKKAIPFRRFNGMWRINVASRETGMQAGTR